MNTPCSIALLESALAGNLPADDEASLHRHLEECEAVRRRAGTHGGRAGLVPGSRRAA